MKDTKLKGTEPRCQNGHAKCSGKTCAKPTGQPTAWEPRFNDQIVDWFNKEPSFAIHFDKNGRPYPLLDSKFPTFEGFAFEIGVNGDTLVEWAKKENEEKYPGYAAAYTRAHELQKKFLIESAMTGAANTQFAIFFAKNNLGMKDKIESDITSNGNTINVMTFGADDPLAKAIAKGERKDRVAIEDLKP